MLEPCVRKDTVQTTKNVDQVFQAHVFALRVVQYHKSTREDVLIRYYISSPVESVAAVVDCAAALGLFMHGTEKLPLGRAHLRARCSTAGRCIKQKSDNKGVALRDEESAKLVEPQCSIDTGGRLRNLMGCRSRQCSSALRCEVIMQSSEVLL